MDPNVSCEKCSKPLEIKVGQSIIDEKLVWHASFSCQECQYWLEEDGMGEMPDNYRSIIIKEKGLWQIEIFESKNMAQILKVLRTTFDLSIGDVVRLKKNIPGVLYKGTLVEMKRLEKVFRKYNISCRVTTSN
ncbi:hypothetical protein [Risungbinella massiliensis]|uniref:hypothetical protein n=1 Tax=Risungbinella massiliensis TaxID=1329796 RepID=UPI0005CC694F|nr:hypothetical protein [Risungbinella massiliensis]